ncbi:MAG: response regulator [Thermoflexales bacterium]|nr:response regulator [Thermoflexales bacterium]
MPPVNPQDVTVLVIEDNLNNFLLMARLLAFVGVGRCEWKASGWQVLEYAETLPHIDLILMDIFLPERDGYEALSLLRSDPRFKDIPVIAITADASVESMERARQAGFNGFIGKPIDPDRFPEQIRRILRGEPVWDPGM